MLLDRAFRYLALLILGRLLEPRDFGVFAALYVMVGGLALLQGFGIGQALICRKDKVEEAASTSFYLSVVLGLLLGVAAWLLAPVVAAFYREPAMCELFRAASAVLLLRALRLVPFHLFEKALDFRKKFVPGLASSSAYLAVALYLAFRGWGAWALVGAEIASVFAEAVACWVISSWRPKLIFSPVLARQDLSFGWAVLGGSALVFALRNVDRVTLSRVLGTHELGLYAFAYAIASVPVMLFARILNTVLFPSYSALHGDKEEQRKLYLRATSYLTGTSILFVLGLLVLGGYVLTALYGGKWTGAIVPLSILSVFGFSRALTDLCGDLLIGTGDPAALRRVNALQLVMALAGLYPGAVWGGVAGVATAMTLAAAAALAYAMRLAYKAVGAGARDLWRAVGGPLSAFALLLLPSAGLLKLLPQPASLAAAVFAISAMTLGFLLVWLGVDRELRSDVSGWLTSRATASGRGAGGRP